MSSLLSMTRDELMPAVWAAQTENLEFNVIIEDKNNALVVAGRNHAKGLELGFAITHAAIVDGVYRSIFHSTMQMLITLLEECEIAELEESSHQYEQHRLH